MPSHISVNFKSLRSIYYPPNIIPMYIYIYMDSDSNIYRRFRIHGMPIVRVEWVTLDAYSLYSYITFAHVKIWNIDFFVYLLGS